MKTQLATRFLNRSVFAAVSLAWMTAMTVRGVNLYQSTVLGDQPVAYYPINQTVDNTSSTVATDLSGNDNNGTYNGVSPFYNPAAGPSPYIPDALQFDGLTGSFVDLSTGNNPGLLNFGGPITMEAWVQPANTTQGPADILAKGYDSSQSDNELVLRANAGNYYGGTFSDTNNIQGASGGQQTTDWAYVVCTYDGTNWNMYVNSVLVQSNPDSVGAINFSTPWAIGTGTANGNSRYFEGNLTEVALYTHALTPAQVLNHFCVGELGTSSASSIPIILTQPQPQTAAYGGSATFTVQAVSALATTNQWYKNNVAISGATNATLTLNSVGAGDAVNYSVVVGNSNGSTNSDSVSLTVVAANSLKWNAVNSSDVWDTGTTANWLNLSNSTQTVFNTFDQVLFDDTAGVSNNVTINGTVSPSLITVNSSTNNFTFAQGSSPALSGPGSLVKQGTSLLTIFAPSGFAGSVSVQGGSIYAGNNCFHSVASITVTNNATLDLAGGSTSGGQIVTLSGNGVGGMGSLYNSYSDGNSELYNIVLTGDTTFGCASGAVWGLQSGSTISGNHKLAIKWGGSEDYTEWNGVKFLSDLGDIELVNGKLGIKNMGSNFGNPAGTFTVDAGTELDFWTSDFGYAKNYHVFGKYQILAAFTTLNANYTLEDGCQFTGIFGGGNQTITGTFMLNGIAHFVLGDGNFIFTNVISGPGGFLWDAYNHQLILQSSNTYTGPTIIGGGQQILALSGSGSISHSSLIFFGGGINNSTNTTIDVTGRPDQTLTLASGQTLGGIGGIKGSLTVSAGAILAPAGTNITLSTTTGANPAGAIAVANNVTLNGTTVIKLNGSGVNDQIQAGGNINYGGTLNLANISGSPLAAGNSFQVFSAAGTCNGSFANITPTTPGAGLAWDTSQLNIGFINVVASTQPVIGDVHASGGSLIFSGSGGTANAGYAVLTTTNLAAPNWIPVMTNNFDGSGAFSVTNAISTGTPQLFYRIQQLP